MGDNRTYDEEPFEVRWGVKDVIAYALASGAEPRHALPFLYEPLGPRVLPAFVSFLGSRWIARQRRAQGDGWGPAIAVRQSWQQHRPLAPAGSAMLHWGVRSARPTRSGAIVETWAELRSGDEVLGTTRSTGLVRTVPDDAVLTPAEPRPRLPLPDRTPDAVATIPTYVQQAAVYRLLLDLDPGRVPADALHIDPAAAAAVGFPRPVLHGLAVEALLARVGPASELAGGAALVAMDIEFAGPLVPGEELAVDLWRTAPGALTVRATVGDRLPVALAVLTLQSNEKAR